jgi:hypothetical protein
MPAGKASALAHRENDAERLGRSLVGGNGQFDSAKTHAIQIKLRRQRVVENARGGASPYGRSRSFALSAASLDELLAAATRLERWP